MPDYNEIINSTRPIFILDVDGPLNPFLATYEMLDDPESWISYKDRWNSARINPERHGRYLREVLSLADLVWGTLWRDEANDLLNHYIIHEDGTAEPPHPYIEIDDLDEKPTWKLPSIALWLQEIDPTGTRKIIWLDDEIWDDGFEWAQQRGNALFVKADPRTAWTKNQQTQIMEFLTEQ